MDWLDQHFRNLKRPHFANFYLFASFKDYHGYSSMEKYFQVLAKNHPAISQHKFVLYTLIEAARAKLFSVIALHRTLNESSKF